MTRFRDLPVLITYLAAVAAAVITCFPAHVSQETAAVVVTVGTGVAAVISSLLARPISTGVLAGAFGTVAAGVAGFGIHVPTQYLGLLAVAVSALVAFFHHSQVSPITHPAAPA